MKSIEHDIENDTQAAKSNTRSFQTNNCIHGKDDGGIEHRIDHHAESAFASLAFGFGMSMAPSSPMLPSLVMPPNGCLQPGCPIPESYVFFPMKLVCRSNHHHDHHVSSVQTSSKPLLQGFYYPYDYPYIEYSWGYFSE